MNVLFITNAAPGYHRFFNPLIQQFTADGHNVAVAVDSRYSAHINMLAELAVPVHIFSDFFSKHGVDVELLHSYADYNLNAALLSDFERAEIYRLWGRRDGRFFDNLKSALLAFYDEIVVSKRIDLIIHENVSSALSHFAWFVCQKHRIPYCGIASSRLPGRYVFSDDPHAENAPISKTLSKISTGEIFVPDSVEEWCANYLENLDDISPDYMSFNGLDQPKLWARYATLDKVRMFVTALNHSMPGGNYFAFQTANPLHFRIQLFMRSAKRRARISRLRSYYSSPPPGERYILYPLQFHPESSTSVLAGAYLDEYEVIRNLAFNLPQGTKLYVKDHLSAYGTMELRFYEKLRRLPNVRIIEPYAPTKTLIRQSLGVATLTSTVGYEALLLGKRVFLYGRVFYQDHVDVVRVHDPSTVFTLMCEWLDLPVRATREYNLHFLQAYYLSTEPGTLQIGGPHSAELARRIYPQIIARFLPRPQGHNWDAVAP